MEGSILGVTEGVGVRAGNVPDADVSCAALPASHLQRTVERGSRMTFRSSRRSANCAAPQTQSLADLRF
jgi:hypothetical protein